MKKSILSVLLSVCTVISLTMTACAAQEIPEDNTVAQTTDTAQQNLPFSDISHDDWYAEAVQYCYEHGIFAGTTATTFSPADTMSRAMLATMLWRMESSPAANSSAGFSDTQADAWYADAVDWAVEAGILSGYGDGRFGPNNPVSREQAVTILWRYAEMPAAESTGTFSDAASVSDWASSAAGWALSAGLLTGRADDNFQPQSGLTRAEAAVLLYRYLEGGTEPSRGGNSILVAYFSATGTTRPLAEYAADILNADLYEIIPEDPYTEEDLAYYTDGRADQEQNNPDARPAISGEVENMAQYDVVLLGYPIWHGQAPRIISTFLESHDLSGKTIVPFCTSHSSGIGSSDDDLHSLAPDADWLDGQRFASGTSRDEIERWIDGLDLPETGDTSLAAGTGKAENRAGKH